MLDAEAQEFYRSALETGEGSGACGFSLAASQMVRFEWVLKNLLRNERRNVSVYTGSPEFSLLDVGCGTGDLLAFLLAEGLPPTGYLGIDLMPEMIDRCEERWPVEHRPDAVNFVCGDVDEVKPGGFDYSVAVATFCLKPREWGQEQMFSHVTDTLMAMAQATRKAMFVTVLSTWKNDIQPDEWVMDPMLLWGWAKATLSERVDLIHSYASHDFGLYVDFRPSDWRLAWEEEHGGGSADPRPRGSR